MRLDKLIMTECLEGHLTDEQLAEVRLQTIQSFDVDEAMQYHRTFIEYLADKYREKIEEGYFSLQRLRDAGL